jgi:hypothetical protein
MKAIKKKKVEHGGTLKDQKDDERNRLRDYEQLLQVDPQNLLVSRPLMLPTTFSYFASHG